MKANAPRRKVFSDAIDLLTDDMPVTVVENGMQMIPVESIKPFHNHPFRMYEGERLEDMVDSIKEHGVLNPVIVHKTEDGYEMLSGHNRWNAAKIAGFTEVPAIVKDGLTEEEAYVYVIETNLMQRSFTDMLPSEKAAVLKERYDKVISQGKRNDIIRELEVIKGINSTCGNDFHKSRKREGIGEEYGYTGRMVANFLRINELIPELKEWVDIKKINLMTAVQLSYAPEEIQKTVYTLGKPINKEMAVKLRKEGVTISDVIDIVCGTQKKSNAAVKPVRISADLYERYFKGTDAEAVESIVAKALVAWFEEKEA